MTARASHLCFDFAVDRGVGLVVPNLLPPFLPRGFPETKQFLFGRLLLSIFCNLNYANFILRC